MIMEIILESGISSDGFKIKIENDFNHTYRYGYDASYDTKFANDSKPYVSDIIFELMKEYEISPSDVKIINGHNTFKGEENTDNIEEFREKYCEEAFNKYYSYYHYM